eukprot:CAMPEP_0183331674 /NCGR_PEP_ID=MMETSP0164_2-20130417/1007_1 /TAXON_ID=221442 /ORGANISM="Coccolithus pelagicus ssp braarudi, Strain PLY182g" /LENGTH=92 /DNA_ID=CAMNT_0025500219 /DNA_START=48 /DNA_END=326 /DNA_ORIENTATION=-
MTKCVRWPNVSGSPAPSGRRLVASHPPTRPSIPHMRMHEHWSSICLPPSTGSSSKPRISQAQSLSPHHAKASRSLILHLVGLRITALQGVVV